MAVEIDDIGRAIAAVNVTLCGSCGVILGRKTMTLDALREEFANYSRKAS